MADQSDGQYGSLNAWLEAVQKDLKAAKPRDKATDEEISKFFAKWGTLVNSMSDDAKSRILDSSEMESRHAVDQLTKKADGTTVVRYYFPNDAAEVNGVCSGDALLQSECAPLKNEDARKLTREAMKDIVAESGAKIELDEVFSLQQADITFVKSPRVIEAEGTCADGYAGRAGDKNYIVDGTSGSNFRQLMEEVFNQLQPEKQEKFREEILREYGSKYGKDADIFTIVTSEHEKMVIAHEIEHTLGAEHPDATAGVQLTNQTIMGHTVLANSPKNEPGKALGSIDVEWYQRHFGVKHLSEGDLPAPSPIQGDKPGQGHER